MVKNLLKTNAAVIILGALLGLYLATLLKTVRWQRLKGDGLGGKVEPDKAAIIVHWHGRILGFPVILKYGVKPFHLISQSRDGKISQWLARWNGIGQILGSSNKGGAVALIALRRHLKHGKTVAITPDGPRGPARQANESAIRLAAMTGAPIIPFAWAAAPAKRTNSWDKMMIPTWFARGVYALGNPIHISKNASPDTIKQETHNLENAINHVTAQVDAHFGYPADHIPERYGNPKK